MLNNFQRLMAALLRRRSAGGPFALFDPEEQARRGGSGAVEDAGALNAAFLLALTGSEHAAGDPAKRMLAEAAGTSEQGTLAEFYLRGLERIRTEMEAASREDTRLAKTLAALPDWVSQADDATFAAELAERLWSVFCPEAAGIRGHEHSQTDQLRERRTVRITSLNPNPIRKPAEEILFTANVLLTLPAGGASLEGTGLGEEVLQGVRAAVRERQRHWYDHPIQIGTEIESHEAVYGLRGLDGALNFEEARGNLPAGEKMPVVLSLSTTHHGLRPVARKYLEDTFARADAWRHIEPYGFSEEDTRRLFEEVLRPAAECFLGEEDPSAMGEVFGVDGPYGRHFTFLKAIAALWSVFIDPRVRATFKFDLDQVFPQKELVAEAGGSAFELFQTPLWGAHGADESGDEVELGMLAGALVNQADIGKSLFTPDVPFPPGAEKPDEFFFFSSLPQALSTEAEMMTRYGTKTLDGHSRCLQRVHVTGGTTGILLDSLRRHRPFTPSFIGRAEDQAYLLSCTARRGPRLAYLHGDGLIMRHDKHSFAHEAIAAARLDKLIGDYVRLLNFTAYAGMLDADTRRLKQTLDPFTGCFVSRLPFTVTFLRFALRAAWLCETDRAASARFIGSGASRLEAAARQLEGAGEPLRRKWNRERQGWELYFDTLEKCEEALAGGNAFAEKLRERAKEIVEQCGLSAESGR